MSQDIQTTETRARLTKRRRELIQEKGKAYQKERSVIRNEGDVDSRARVTRDEERMLQGG